MLSTADLISGLVACRSTRNVSNCRVSCDSSFAASAFSVITGDLMMSQTVLIVTPPPAQSCVFSSVLREPVHLIRSRPHLHPFCLRATPRVHLRQNAKEQDGRDRANRRCSNQNCS